MDRLSSCYFCGVALDAPLEEYPVVPRDLDPAEQARITLCPTCRRKLGGVVERVVEAADADALAERETDTEAPPSTGDPIGDATAAEPREPSGASNAADGAPRVPDEEVTDDATSDDPGAAPDADSPETPDTTPDEPTDVDESTAIVADEEDDQSLSALEYNRVMRLLENREFPVDRAEFATIATQAYDVSRSDVDALIAAAEERGLLAVEGDQLVRPEE